MDVDNEQFYDDIASFMPQPGDYCLDDLDEIIRSTDSHLDASLDLNIFANALNQNDFDMTATTAKQTGFVGTRKNDLANQSDRYNSQHQQQQETSIENEYNFNFAGFPSPPTSDQSADYSSSPCETPARTSSTSSIDGDNFNPDDFINFLNDDDVKIDDLTRETIMKLNEDIRNTPSPTGSCTSSSGSSTSGIQSDASSVASMSQMYNHPTRFTMTCEHDDDLSEFIKFKNEKSDSNLKMHENNDNEMNQTHAAQIVETNLVMSPAAPAFNDKQKITMASASTPTTTTTIVPITMPVLPMATIQPIQSLNFVQGTIIPVQTVPLTTVTSAVNLKTPTAIKMNPKITTSKPVKVISNTSATPSQSSAGSNCVGSPKVTAPPNAKPKTIFLSSNDFKALMQKMDTNGTSGKKLTGANGQMPKIIMKTASGKVITANKVTTPKTANVANASSVSGSSSSSTSAVTSSNPQSLQFVSKMVKASGHMMAKQQSTKCLTSNSRSAVAMAAARANLSHTKSCRTDMGIFKGFNDDKVFKKQLRMLKNRESASLSRKKKKEYVERLENRINNLEKENYTLKGENTSLRSQLMAFAQTCNCKHGNVSEFILNTLNMNEKHGGAIVNAIDTSFLSNSSNSNQYLESGAAMSNLNCTGTTTQHIKIAPKPANATSSINKGFKHRMNATSVKKNLAVLFAMAFMVTLNVGNFQTYLNKSALENALETPVAGVNEEPVVAGSGRRLLWVPNEHEFQEQNNRSKRESDMASMPPPPLHFLRPVNRTTGDKMNGTSAKDEPPIKLPTIINKYGTATTATTYGNATQENMRLARNLHKWIGGNDYLNLTGPGTGTDFEEIPDFKFGSTTFMDYDLPLQAPVGTKQKRKIFFNTETVDKQTKLDIDASDRNSLDLFKPTISEEYLRLFRGIKRQDDTFYVLSFNMDHILLPASAYNKSSRPKMSLMLPAGDPSRNGDIVLMQIDCEVINTTELEIKSHMIPEKLRPSKYTANVRVNPNDVANNETAGPVSAGATTSNEIHLKREELKEKPTAPRTYFMMGPKNQASSNSANSVAAQESVIKRKPTIVKLNANDSVIGSGVLNVRNSTLFSRMRETVGSHNNNGFVAASDVKKLI